MATKTYGSLTITNIEQFYTWIKFADDEWGNGMSDSPSGKSYMGVALKQISPVESDVSSDYKWTLIKGQDTMSCYIESSAGTSFEQGATGTTTLVAYLYEGTNKIDVDGKFDYTWYTNNKDGEETEIGRGRTLTVDIDTVAGKSVYFMADDGDEENTSVLYLARLGIIALGKGI